MKKGQDKRVWTPEQKAEIVCKHLNDPISIRPLEKQRHADRGVISKWVKKYIAEGENSLSIKITQGTHSRRFMSAKIFPK